LLGLLYGSEGKHQFLIQNPMLWFLAALFSTEVILLLLCKLTLKLPEWVLPVTLVAAAAVGYAAGQRVELPWGIDLALMALPFLYVGMLLRKRAWLSAPRSVLTTAAITLAMCALVFVAVWFNGRIDINKRLFNNPLLFYFGGIMGSIFMLSLAQLIERLKGVAAACTYLGQESMTIMVFHLVSFTAISGAARFVFHANVDAVQSKYWYAYFLWGVLFSVGVGYLINAAKRPRQRAPEPAKVPVAE
jgi:fucose 4-O-acetylase-like acetyltransferase